MTQRKIFWIAFGLLIVVGFAMGGCGDRSVKVTYQNETDHAVIVYPYGRDYAAGKRLLGAGETKTDNLLAGDAHPATHTARVEAVDESGDLVYCHSFNYAELSGNGGVIHIRVGDNTC
jgi:hypothetical protein